MYKVDTLVNVPPKIFIISADYYTKNLGFICKQEFKLEKKSKIPFRFRLGSLAYANMLEGKKY